MSAELNTQAQVQPEPNQESDQPVEIPDQPAEKSDQPVEVPNPHVEEENQQIENLDLVDLIELEFDDEEEIMYINPAKRRKGQQLLSDYFQKWTMENKFYFNRLRILFFHLDFVQ